MQVKSLCQTWNVKYLALALLALAACLFHLRVVKGERCVAVFAALKEQAWWDIALEKTRIWVYKSGPYKEGLAG